MNTDPRREEQAAKMMAEYRAELDSLTDIEFWEHWKTAVAMKDMTEAQWQEACHSWQGGIRI